MSYSLKRKAQSLLAQEQGAVRKDWGGKVTVALVYPNSYAVGMSNLGFQTIYAHLNRLPDVVCERVFLPDPEDIAELHRTRESVFSLESQRPLRDFHLVGFGHLARATTSTSSSCCARRQIPPRRRARRARPSCSWAGSAPSNPEPLAPFMDLVAVGEGEELVGELVAAHRTANGARDAFLDAVTSLEGVYVPATRSPYDDEGRLLAVTPGPVPRPSSTSAACAT
jgi:radical SAM superfamily enzyme YgiQ (UPF0313 family)